MRYVELYAGTAVRKKFGGTSYESFIIPAMLLAASVYTCQMQKVVERWKMEGGLPPVPGQKVDSLAAKSDAPVEVPLFWKKDDLRILPKHDLGPAITGPAEFAGTFVVYDWDSREIIWQPDWGKMVSMP